MVGAWRGRGRSVGLVAWVLVAIVSVLVMASPARAVGEFADVYLYDGRHFFGKIVEESTSKLVLEVHHGSIVADMTFGANEVEKIDRQEIKAAPEGAAGDGAAGEGDRDDDEAGDDAVAPGAGGYAIIPISGVVGEELTAGFFKAVRKEAERAGAEAVIFHLDSPGGMVREMEPIREALDEIEDGGTRLAVFVDEKAFSAAALLCLSCKDFYVGDGARVGAAVAFRWGSGAAEVDAKFNAAFAATWRAKAEQAGRNPALVDAMVEMKTELWADTRTEPWTLSTEKPHATDARAGVRTSRDRGADEDGDGQPDDPPDDEDEFVEIDSATTILALTHSQAVNVGAADGLLPSPLDVVAKLDLAAPEREAFDGQRFSERYFRNYRNNMGRAKRAVEDFKAAAAMLQGAGNRTELRNRLREVMANLNRVITLYERYDYVRNYIDSQGISVEQLKGVVGLIRRALGRQ